MYQHMVKHIGRAVLVCIGLQLQACSMFQIGEEDYACQGYPEGVRCLSARQAYELTSTESYKTYADARNPDAKEKADARQASPDEEWWWEGEEGRGAVNPKPTGLAPRAPEIVHATPAPATVPEHSQEPIPIRSPAKVMRIEVRSYEDEKGDLWVPGLIYTEIEERRWSLGLKAPKPTPTISPLEVRPAPQKKENGKSQAVANPPSEKSVNRDGEKQE